MIEDFDEYFCLSACYLELFLLFLVFQKERKQIFHYLSSRVTSCESEFTP